MNIRMQIDSRVVPARAIHAWKLDRLRVEFILCAKWFVGEILRLALATHNYGRGFTAAAPRDMGDPYDCIAPAVVAGAVKNLRAGVV